MKLLLSNNYHLLSRPKPITFMTTFQLHKNLMKLVLCGSIFENEETKKQSSSYGGRSRIQIYQYLPSKPMFMPAAPSLIPLSFKHGDRVLLPPNHSVPCAWLTSFSNWKSKSLSFLFHRAGVGNSIHMSGHSGTLRRRSRSGQQKVHIHLTCLPSS